MRARFGLVPADPAGVRVDLSPRPRSFRLEDDQNISRSIRGHAGRRRALDALRDARSIGWRVGPEERLRYVEELKDRLLQLRIIEAELTDQMLGSSGLDSDLERYRKDELGMRLDEIQAEQRTLEEVLRRALGDNG